MKPEIQWLSPTCGNWAYSPEYIALLKQMLARGGNSRQRRTRNRRFRKL